MKLGVSLAQIYPKLGDLEYNIEKHLEIVKEVKQRSQLLIFPELSLTGSNLMDLVIDIAQTKDSNLLRPILEASTYIDMILGLVELGEDKGLYDSAFYYSNSSLKSIQRKLFLTSHVGSLKYFTSGDRIDVIDARWGKLGVVVGEDILNPLIISPFVKAGIKILIIVSNNISVGYSSNKAGIPKCSVDLMNLLITYARLYSFYIVYVNRVGFEDGINFFGGSCAISPSGEILASCPYFEESVISLELDLETFRNDNIFIDFDKAFKLVKDFTYEY
ncbi:MAG: hypothetical protein N2380_03830 [bacterium]|nr:hypothetical protein [bacterium]